MEKMSDIKVRRFWEKYEVLDKFNQEYSISQPKSSEQFFKFLDEVYNVWRAQQGSQKEIDEGLDIKIRRQAVLYQLAKKVKWREGRLLDYETKRKRDFGKMRLGEFER